MLYAVPPVPPAIVYVEVVPAQGSDTLIADECERGSRDCFPRDRVGYDPEDIPFTALRPWNIDDVQNDSSQNG
ncbi:MAG: hypothetical protein ACHWZW_13275 [Spirulina sp.]